MVPIQMMVYNGCTQNIHQRPKFLYITLPWANKKHSSTSEPMEERTDRTNTDDGVQWMYTEYPPTSPLFVYCITMGKQNALFHKNTDGRGRMLPIQMIVYNGCTQNIHQHPHCLHITLPWANNALFHMLLSLVTLHQALKDTDTLMLTILASVMRSLQTSTCV